MKEKVDLLVKDGIIVTMDGKRRVIDNGAVAIKGNKIVAVANSEEVQNKYSADETINAKGMAVMPGLIDTHTHNLQIFLRGRTWGAPLKIPGWLSLLIPFESALTKEEAYLSGLLSCINMIKVGTTGHIDHGGQFNAFEVGHAMEKTGVRAILSRSTIDMGAPDYFSTSTEDAIKENVKLVEKWNGVAGGRIRAWFSLRQIMVCTDELWVKFSELASKYKTGIQTHLSEGMYEVDWAYNHWGKRPVEHYYETGFLQKNVLIAHAMYLTDKEVKMLKERDVKVAHCPGGNLSRTRVPQMLTEGISVGVGADGGARRGLDLFQDLRIASAVHAAHEIPHYDSAPLSDLALLEMATINGAKVLLWDDEIGSIEPGKKADIILVDLNKPHILPIGQVITALTQRATGQDVDTAIIDGKVVMKNRKLLTMDEDEVLKKVRELDVPAIVKRMR